MPISVDLPAPFSPTMPWIVPGRTTSDTSRLAWTFPNHLSTPRSSMTGGDGPPGPPAAGRVSPPAVSAIRTGRLLGHVVGDLDLAGHDVGARLLEPLLHLRGDQLAVVLVDRVADPALGHAQVADTGLPRPVLGALEGLVDREVDALDHRGEDRAGVDVVLVGVHPDGQLPLVLGGLEHAEPGGAGGRVHDVGAAIELTAGQLPAPGRVVPGGRRGPGHVL